MKTLLFQYCYFRVEARQHPSCRIGRHDPGHVHFAAGAPEAGGIVGR